MKRSNIAVSVSICLLMTGCASVRDGATALGSTGTGAIVGVVAGAGAGVACDKLTKGKNTGACVAAGMAVGAAAGALAASLDEQWEKSQPVASCADVKKRMNYRATEKKPRADIKVEFNPAKGVVKPGESIKPTVKVNLATADGKEIPVKIETNAGNTKVFKKECGGDIPLALNQLPSNAEGPQYLKVKLVSGDDQRVLAETRACYTVSIKSANLCVPAPLAKAAH